MTDDIPDDIDFDAPDAASDTAPLAASSRRPAPPARKGRTGLLLGLLALLGAGGAGGYVYLTQMEGIDSSLVSAVSGVAPAPVPAPEVAELPAPAGLPPASVDAAPSADLAAVPSADPAAPPPVDLASVPPVDLAAAPPVDLAAVPPVDLAAVPPVDLAAVPPVDLAAVPPVDLAAAAEMPAAASAGLPPPPEEPEAPEVIVTPESQTVPAPSPAPVEAAAPQDLPPPEVLPAAKKEMPAAFDAAAQAVPADAPPAVVPDAAERALIDNAAALKAAPVAVPVSDPVAEHAAALAALPAERAIVRPLPDTYIIVRKDAAAGDLGARLEGARSALASGRHQAALSLFTALSQDYPDDTRVAMGRAISLQSMGQNEAALTAYEDVLSHDPKNLEALTNMLGLLKGQDPQLALSRLRELHETYPANADIAAQLGVAFGVTGDYPSAVRYLDVAEALKPGEAFVTYNKAVVYDRMGNGVQAAALYREILARASAGTLDRQLPLDQIRARLAAIR